MWPLVPASLKGCWMGDCSCRFHGAVAIYGICIGKEAAAEAGAEAAQLPSHDGQEGSLSKSLLQ